jgi:uncharacterized repeat protein (TIGR01451 family)
MKYLLCLMALAAPEAASAASQVTLTSDVFVERVRQDGTGKPATVLEPPRTVAAGDRLLFVLSYRNGGAEPAQDFVVTNPVPDAVAFMGADDAEADVSVDWGRNWGKLSALTVKRPDGTARPAQPGDVTHVRWSFRKAIGAGQAGKLSFRAVAR